MRNKWLGGLGAVLLLTLPILGHAQDPTAESCKQTLQANCAQCHGLPRVCTTLDKANANWPAIVARMGNKAGLAKDVQDRVTACLTTGSPKKQICE